MQAEKGKFTLRSHVKHHRSEILRNTWKWHKNEFHSNLLLKRRWQAHRAPGAHGTTITFCFMKRSDYHQTIDITCKDTEHLAGLHIEMQSKTKWVKIKHVYWCGKQRFKYPPKHFKPSKNETQNADEVKEETSKLKWSDPGTNLVWVKDYGWLTLCNMFGQASLGFRQATSGIRQASTGKRV